MRYLLAWAYALHGRSGLGMNGVAPLSYSTIVDWSTLTGNVPDREDVEALIEIDGVLLNPKESEPDATGTSEPVVSAWPSAKPEAV